MQTSNGAHAGQCASGGLGGNSPAAHPAIGAGAVDREVVSIGALTVDRKLSRLTACGWCDGCAGRQIEDAGESTAVDWKMLEFGASDQGSNARIIAVDERSGTFD